MSISVGIVTNLGNDITVRPDTYGHYGADVEVICITPNKQDSAVETLTIGPATHETIDNLIYCLQQLRSTIP